MGKYSSIKSWLPVFILVLFTVILRGQSPALIFDVGEISGCNQDTVLVPVTVLDYQEIMNFSFYLEWNYDSLQFIDVINNKVGDLVLVSDTTLSPIDGVKLIIGTEDLLNPDISLARTFSDGDTLAFIRLVVIARQGIWPITSEPAVLVNNNFFYVNNGARAFSEDMTILPGSVSLTQEVDGLQIIGDSIICGHPEARLRAAADNPSTVFRWSLNGGNLSNADSLLVSAPDVYDLTASRGPFCSTSISYEVLQDTALARPMLDTENLRCDPMMATQRIIAPNPAHSYDWQSNGVSLSQMNELTVSTPGTYFLISTNLASSCIDTQAVVIAPPVISEELREAAMFGAEPLTCSITSVDLSIPLAHSRYTFNWSEAGIPLVEVDSMITVSNGGMFSLTITDTNDGCFRVLDTLIEQDTISPDVHLLGEMMIDCRSDSATLVAVPNQMGSTYEYAWENSQGAEVANGEIFTIGTAGDYVLIISDTDNNCTSTINTNIRQDTMAPTIQLSGSIDPVNCNRRQSMVEVINVPGTTFFWLDGIDTIQRGNTVMVGAGTITLIAQNRQNGCLSDSLISIPADTLRPIFTIDSSGSISCDGTGVDLIINSSNPTYTCFWDEVEVADCANRVTTPGIYVGRLVNPVNECFEEKEIEVVSSILADTTVLLPPERLTCTQDSVQLAVSQPETGLVYEWSDQTGDVVGQGASIYVRNQGAYRVQVANQSGSCARAAIVFVTADTVQPTVSFPNLVLNCDSTSVRLTYTSPNGSAIPEWRNELEEPLSDLQVTQGGLYMLQLTDPSNGCFVRRSIDVFQDTLPPGYQINQPTLLELTCDQPTVIARVQYTGDYEINWSQFPGTIMTNADSTRIVAEGEVLLIVRDRDNGCKDSTLLTVMDQRILPTLNYNAPPFLDCGEVMVSVSVIAESDVVYRLQLPDGTDIGLEPDGTFIVGETGQYLLTARNTRSGCTESEGFFIDATTSDLSFSAIMVNQETCSPGSNSEVVLGDGVGGVQPYSYSIAGQAYPPFDIITELNDGTYNLRLTDARQCFIDTLITIQGYEPFEPQIEGLESGYHLGDEIMLSVQNSLSTDFNYSFTWQYGDSLCQGCNVLEFIALESGDIHLQVERSDGCVEEVHAALRVDERAQIYLPSAFSPNADGINDHYLPVANPARAKIREMLVYDRWGQHSYEEKVDQGQYLVGWNGRVEGEPAAAGTYVIRATYELPDGREGQLKATFQLLR